MILTFVLCVKGLGHMICECKELSELQKEVHGKCSSDE